MEVPRMTAGRPPKPAEIKRITGNPGKRKLPELSVITTLPMAHKIPDAPTNLGEDGLALWNQAWDMAITWLSPQSDFRAIENAAMLADDLAAVRKKYRATLDPADGRLLVHINKAFVDSLSSLGFDPTSRSRLGVAEVKAISAIDKLLEKRQNRN
jgi:phage terminase small subunit